MSNVSGQPKFLAPNTSGNVNQECLHHSLLLRLAELDVQLAQQGTSIGMAAQLVFPLDPAVSAVSPQAEGEK
jgi:hypothetical protein